MLVWDAVVCWIAEGGFRPGGRVTFWFRPESNQRYAPAGRCPAKLAARLQRFAQTSRRKFNFSFRNARRLRARVGDAKALLILDRLLSAKSSHPIVDFAQSIQIRNLEI